MTIKLNGTTQTLDSATVLDVLKKENVKSIEMVSVQLNGEFLDKADYETTQLKDNDELDFLYFMGGGAI